MEYFVLLQVVPVLVAGDAGEAVHQGIECTDKASLLCLSKGYSTFDLPFKTKPNLIKIGKTRCGRQNLEKCRVHLRLKVKMTKRCS